jgi:hypothetical protein
MASMGAGREAGPPFLLSPVSLASGSATWLVELLEDYGFAPHLVHSLRCKAIASARLKNDKVDAAILAQLLRADLLPEAWIARPLSASCGRCCGTGFTWSGCGPCCATGSTPSWPSTVMTGRPAGTGAARAGPGSPPWSCPQCPASWSRTTWA